MNMDCSRPGSPSRWRARVRHRIQPVEAPGGRSPGADQQSSRHTGERPGRPDSQRRFRARRPASPPLRLRAAARSKSTTLRLRPQTRQASDLRKTPPDARSPPDGTWLAAALSGTQTRSNNVDSDLDGCRDHGEAGRERWVGWAVLAHTSARSAEQWPPTNRPAGVASSPIAKTGHKPGFAPELASLRVEMVEVCERWPEAGFLSVSLLDYARRGEVSARGRKASKCNEQSAGQRPVCGSRRGRCNRPNTRDGAQGRHRRRCGRRP